MSSARNHQKRSHRSYRVTKSICGSVARKAWVTPQYIAKATGMTAHTVAKWRSRNGLRKKVRKPRMKKQMDVPGTKPSEEAAPGAGVQKIPIVGEAVEVTEPDFTKSAAPEPRTVTVEELRALLEDACKGGLGECAVLVEGTAFADLWLDVHSTLRIYESGERTVELKGTAKSA